jgi:Ca-activated chloride channel family protein
LIGYENRLLAAEDFNDDQRDAGEVGAGHCVTALYEIVPAGIDLPKSIGSVDPLKYQLTSGADETSVSPPASDVSPPASDVSPPASQQWLTVKVRYKLPGETESQKFEVVAQDRGISFEEAGDDVRFAAAVASFGMLLRESPHRGDSSFDKCLAIAESARGDDPFGFRGEFCELVRIAKQL